jgi:hypothetical protein
MISSRDIIQDTLLSLLGRKKNRKEEDHLLANKPSMSTREEVLQMLYFFFTSLSLSLSLECDT